jgi:hypothetical protein
MLLPRIKNRSMSCDSTVIEFQFLSHRIISTVILETTAKL